MTVFDRLRERINELERTMRDLALPDVHGELSLAEAYRLMRAACPKDRPQVWVGIVTDYDGNPQAAFKVSESKFSSDEVAGVSLADAYNRFRTEKLAKINPTPIEAVDQALAEPDGNPFVEQTASS